MGRSARWVPGRRQWQVSVRQGGAQKKGWAPRGYTRRDKRAAIEAVAPRLEAGMRAVVRSASPVRTLSEFCEVVYGERHGVSDRTWERRRLYEVAAIMAALGHHELGSLTTAQVRAWEHTMLAAGLSPVTVATRMTALRAIYRVAVVEGFLREVPFHVPAARVSLKPRRPAWSTAQVDALIAAAGELVGEPARRRDRDVWLTARWLRATGCRPVGALSITWHGVRVVEVPRRVEVVDITAKGYERTLPVSDEMRSVLADARVGHAEALGYVFMPTLQRRDGNALRPRWAAVCRAAGLRTDIYGVRRWFITDRLIAGVDKYKLARWCGTSLRVIEAHYDWLVAEHLLEVVQPARVVPASAAEVVDEL